MDRLMIYANAQGKRLFQFAIGLKMVRVCRKTLKVVCILIAILGVFIFLFPWVEKELIDGRVEPKRLYHYRGDTSSSRNSDKAMPTRCKPVDNILFLKTHKTGSSTLENILNRYGDKRDLLFALPAIPDFNWPRPFLPSSAETFGGAPNILSHHARFNKAPMNWLFPRNTTRYITILREPTEQFVSIFNYCRQFPRTFGNQTAGVSPLENFLRNKEYYMKHVKLFSNLNLIKNPALFDLGLGRKYQENFTVVRNYIGFLQQEFDLVMLMEYYDESLVLLKRRFCWKMEDILYFKLNERTPQEKQNVTRLVREQIRKWNSGDVLLYNVFNQTLWEMIQREGPSFFRDLALFKKEKEAMKRACLQEGTFLAKPLPGKIVQGYAVKPNMSMELQTTCNKMIMFARPYMAYLRKKMTLAEKQLKSSAKN